MPKSSFVSVTTLPQGQRATTPATRNESSRRAAVLQRQSAARMSAENKSSNTPPVDIEAVVTKFGDRRLSDARLAVYGHADLERFIEELLPMYISDCMDKIQEHSKILRDRIKTKKQIEAGKNFDKNEPSYLALIKDIKGMIMDDKGLDHKMQLAKEFMLRCLERLDKINPGHTMKPKGVRVANATDASAVTTSTSSSKKPKKAEGHTPSRDLKKPLPWSQAEIVDGLYNQIYNYWISMLLAKCSDPETMITCPNGNNMPIAKQIKNMPLFYYARYIGEQRIKVFEEKNKLLRLKIQLMKGENLGGKSKIKQLQDEISRNENKVKALKIQLDKISKIKTPDVVQTPPRRRPNPPRSR